MAAFVLVFPIFTRLGCELFTTWAVVAAFQEPRRGTLFLMNDLLSNLKGKRTYYVVTLGVLYVLGALLGFYELDEKILAVFGLGGLGFLRAALGKTVDLKVGSGTQEGRKEGSPLNGGDWQREDEARVSRRSSFEGLMWAGAVACLGMVAAALVLSGCARLAPDGVYKGDQVLFRADKVITSSYEVMHSFVQWELSNRRTLEQWPEIREAADVVRNNAQRWIDTAISLREAYAANPNDATRRGLDKALDTLATALAESAAYMARPLSDGRSTEH